MIPICFKSDSCNERRAAASPPNSPTSTWVSSSPRKTRVYYKKHLLTFSEFLLHYKYHQRKRSPYEVLSSWGLFLLHTIILLLFSKNKTKSGATARPIFILETKLVFFVRIVE